LRFGLTLIAMFSGLLSGVLTGLLNPAGASGSAVTIAFVPIPVAEFAVQPAAGAVLGDTLVLWGTGEATATVELTEPTVRLEFSARADPCQGLPELDVGVDGHSVFEGAVAGAGDYAVRGHWAPGRHTLSFGFGNDHVRGSCDRNIVIRSVGMWTNGPGGPTSYVEQRLNPAAVSFTPASAGMGSPSAARLRANGSFTGSLDSHAAKRFTMRLTARACAGLPRFRLSIDDVMITEQQVPAVSANGPNGAERVYTIEKYWADGVHKVKVSFLNDRRTATCDRNMAVVSAYFSGTV
jgi:hypothetical protein